MKLKTRMRPCMVVNTVTNAMYGWKTEEVPGVFHKWGIVAHGTTMSTAAIVEMEDGRIRLIEPTKIRFLKETE